MLRQARAARAGCAPVFSGRSRSQPQRCPRHRPPPRPSQAHMRSLPLSLLPGRRTPRGQTALCWTASPAPWCRRRCGLALVCCPKATCRGGRLPTLRAPHALPHHMRGGRGTTQAPAVPHFFSVTCPVQLRPAGPGPDCRRPAGHQPGAAPGGQFAYYLAAGCRSCAALPAACPLPPAREVGAVRAARARRW